ncbi:penicillin-binding transpeptidase domain-containing protein [Anaerovorax sp. IOR16]|uniref:penicillin-binding transpeptidase domain-containing protein n=1 Tax=Anaerovorax sp. IOR16 TaxID=2773458 RepID=UPI0019D04A5B|nr:penicillin-binding transpeptidase domain-containing protein [Anaerovorax sp. IOR16]
MNHWIKSRNNQILLATCILMSMLMARLFFLTVVQGSDWSETARNISVKKLYTVAPRGQIYDRYGRVLAGNKPSFTVHFSAGELSDEEINREALQLIGILEENGDLYRDNFPIVMDGNGGFYYTFNRTIQDWLAAQGMPATFTAEQSFNEIRRRNNIDEGMDKYEAQSQLQTVYNIYPPISVKNMEFLETLELNSFLDRYYLDHDLSAKDAFLSLREQCQIDPSLPDSQARKILMVRNELAAQGYRRYIPATIAKDVSDRTIITIEERSSDLLGVDVVAESVRYYPNDNTAAHILGYLGQISESEKESYMEKGYSVSDMVGKDGIEKKYEEILKGRDGIKSVEVNAYGEQTRIISDTKTEKGKDVYLTLDLELQKTAEDALEQALLAIQKGGSFQSKWGNYKYGTAYSNANVGAVVALDVKTGDVLAMASYPDFNPNLFATGITKEDWQSLQGKNLRDPLSPVPLFNVAARTAVQPGSTFKLVTATAALESGLDPQRKLRDGGYVKLGRRTYGCLLWNRYKRNHGLVNLYEAIEVSCNYYFYDLVSNKDYSKGISLGLDRSMGIEKIMEYAQQYGLGLPTGIEIAETVAPVPTAEGKMKNTKSALRNVLFSRAELYFTKETIANKEKLNSYIDQIVSWTEENPSYSETLKRMKNVGLKEDMQDTVADLCKFSYYNMAAFTTGDELNISIGQGENAYTPLQMANYIATLANKGVLNQVSVVKGVEGKGALEKVPGTKMNITDDSIFDDLIEGMHRVASGSKGSARGVFGNFPVTVAAKTGTAERGGKINPPDEVEYVKKYLSRIDSRLRWSDVEEKMYSLMEEYPEVYQTKNSAVRQAVMLLSNGKVTAAKIDAYKADYDNFAWFVCLAPIEEPQIAISVLLFQGGSGGYAAPIAREIIAQYMGLDQAYTDYDLSTTITQ